MAMSKTIPGLQGTIVANKGMNTSYYAKNKIGKFVDLPLLDTILNDSPQPYDKRMIDFFTQTRLYSNDFINLIEGRATPFYVNDPKGTFEYNIKKYSELPKVMMNLADTTAQPGIDGTTFELVFDKNAFSKGDTITAHRREQETQIHIVSDPVKYQGYFKYECAAIGPVKATAFVHQDFLRPGTEYIKLGFGMGEFSTDLSSLGLIDGHLKVITKGLQQYGVEHSVTDWANAAEKNRDGVAYDTTYFSVADPMDKTKFIPAAQEPAILTYMKMEMLKMRANMLLWGQSGTSTDDKGNPIQFIPGVWRQMHRGNVIHYDRGGFNINMLRYAIWDLLYSRVKQSSDREIVVYTNTAGSMLASQAIKSGALAEGFVFNAGDYVKGKDNLSLGYSFDFNYVIFKNVGKIRFETLNELDQAYTYLELGKDRRTPPVFLIMDVTGDGKDAGLRKIMLKNRPSMYWGTIKGATGISGMDRVVSASRDPWDSWWMKDFCGTFLEDPTRTVLIKENPQFV